MAWIESGGVEDWLKRESSEIAFTSLLWKSTAATTTWAFSIVVAVTSSPLCELHMRGGFGMEVQLEGLGPNTETRPATITSGTINNKSFMDEDEYDSKAIVILLLMLHIVEFYYMVGEMKLKKREE